MTEFVAAIRDLDGLLADDDAGVALANVATVDEGGPEKKSIHSKSPGFFISGRGEDLNATRHSAE